MFRIILQEAAQKSLDDIQDTDPKMFSRIISGLEEMENRGLKSSSVKRLANTNSIFRKRVGRYRLLFTIFEEQIDLWIVEIEKDTKKDYKRWIRFIEKCR